MEIITLGAPVTLYGYIVDEANPRLLEEPEPDALYFSSAIDLQNHIDCVTENLNFFSTSIVKNTARIANLYNEVSVFSRLKDMIMQWGGTD